jgi:hypothetical protein
MTAKKDFKRRVRERQAKTGESYTAARAQLIAERGDDDADVDEPNRDEPDKEPPFSVVELIDATDDAASLGFKCHVLVSPSLVDQIAPARALERLRDALLATERDPEMYLLRALAFRGVRRPMGRERYLGRWDDVRRFIERAMVGIGGLTLTCDMLAFSADGVMVIAQADAVPDMPAIPRLSSRPPRLFLTTPHGHRLGDVAYVVPR